MESLLEQQRRYHEERERLTEAMTKETLLQKKTVIIVSFSLYQTIIDLLLCQQIDLFLIKRSENVKS